jgi:CRP-like cAMP-binding protein
MDDGSAVEADALRDKSVFFGLEDEQLAMIAACSRRQVFAPGEFLFREGDPGDALFIIEKGHVELFRTRPNGERVTFATVKDGALLGEMSLVNIEPRSASGVIAPPPGAQGGDDQSARVIVIRNNDLAEFLREDKDFLIVILLNITRILSKRLRQADQKLL